MSAAETVVYVIFIILYTIFAIVTVCNFKTLAGGIAGSCCLIAGGAAVYYIVPIVITIITGILQAIFSIVLVVGIIAALFDS